jgi:hypothetical protein
MQRDMHCRHAQAVLEASKGRTPSALSYIDIESGFIGFIGFKSITNLHLYKNALCNTACTIACTLSSHERLLEAWLKAPQPRSYQGTRYSKH